MPFSSSDGVFGRLFEMTIPIVDSALLQIGLKVIFDEFLLDWIADLDRDDRTLVEMIGDTVGIPSRR